MFLLRHSAAATGSAFIRPSATPWLAGARRRFAAGRRAGGGGGREGRGRRGKGEGMKSNGNAEEEEEERIGNTVL
jgi:hypothetical protein